MSLTITDPATLAALSAATGDRVGIRDAEGHLLGWFAPDPDATRVPTVVVDPRPRGLPDRP